MKQFECFWGDGYRNKDNKSLLAYHDIDFFNELCFFAIKRNSVFPKYIMKPNGRFWATKFTSPRVNGITLTTNETPVNSRHFMYFKNW